MVVLLFCTSQKEQFFLGSKILQKRLSMRPRKQKHPKYKAYFSHQLRILKERFPFLSSQQIKAKILSTWEGLSPEKKNDWGILPTAKLQNGNNGTLMSPCHSSPPRCLTPYERTSPHHKDSTKKVQFSQLLSPGSLPGPELPEDDSMENSENSEASLLEFSAWPVVDEFNVIVENELAVEEKGKQSESSGDEEMPSEQRNIWPTLFGDTTSIWKAVKTKENSKDKEQPMCHLFQEVERKHFSKRRILAGLSPKEIKASTDLFEGENDDDIFT